MSRSSKAASVDLPKTVGTWTRSDEIRRILPDKIFDYMDGAGELYIGYRFNHLDVSEYSAPGEDQILVELYWMETSDDAFGLLSGDWGGEPVDLGGSTATRGAGPAWLPDRRALYGAGLLRIWSGDLYARVMAYRESARSKEAVLTLGRIITAGRKSPPAASFLDALPPSAAPDFMLRNDRICYFRSHLVLNSVYFLSTGNILDLDRSAEAVTASYAPAKQAGLPRSVQLILVRYPNDDSAQKALAHFEQVYLPEKHKASPKSSPGGSQFWQIEDGWLGYSRSGRALALVFECPDRDSATQFIKESMARLNHLEALHE
jgi:hypothetical protein